MFGKSKIAYDSSTDENLMKAILAKDNKAFAELYDRYFDKLVWYASGFVDDTHKAEDIVQEVFVKIIENPGQFNTDLRFSTWVYTITGNICRNYLRNETNRMRIIEKNILPAMTTNVQAVNGFDLKILKQTINNVYSSLSEKEKNIFILRFEQELSLKEIAEIIEIPEGSVKSGIYYLLKKFTPYLKEFNYGTSAK